MSKRGRRSGVEGRAAGEEKRQEVKMMVKQMKTREPKSAKKQARQARRDLCHEG